MSFADRLAAFYSLAVRLKSLRRAGWVQCGHSDCESVADHSFGVALLALVASSEAEPTLDRERCLALALVHDLAEALVGDITPADSMAPQEKQRLERDAMGKLAQTLGHRELETLWEEFEAGMTPEARFVRDLDVIEMASQAEAYREVGTLRPSAADRFIASALARTATPTGRALLAAIASRGRSA